ncbi:hypothetical protein WJX79_005114 [Trebouxia sp. C0005]
MQAQDIPVALAKCLQGLLSMLQIFNTMPDTAGTASDAQQAPERGPADASQQQQQMESTGLYVQCCLCMTKRACQLATAGQGVLQDVAGLLQDQLQRSDSLVTAIFCQHCTLLLQDALSLDMLLRILPLLRTEQQAAVYKAFIQCIAKPIDTDAREPQAVTSLTQHCHRQMEQFVLSNPILPSHPGHSRVLLHQPGVQVGTELPENQEEDLRQRVARLGGIVMNLVEVFLNSLMTQPETLAPILGNCLTSEGCTAAGKDSTSSPFESRLSHQTMAVVLHLLALHSALQAAHKAGKTKAVRNPVFISLSGARGLLKFAAQLLTEKAGSQLHRRRSRHVTKRASNSTPALDAHLAAYLLTLLTHRAESQLLAVHEQPVATAPTMSRRVVPLQVGSATRTAATRLSTVGAAKEEMLAEVLQDDPDQYVDDASRAEACTHSPADPLASTPSVPSQAKALPALRSLSSASGRRRILTADEVAHRRQHQKALLEAVTLLTACLKHLQASDTPPPLQTQPDYQEPASAKLAKRNALSDQQQLKAHVMTACQLIDPSMGYAGTTAANAGASMYVMGSACLLLLGHLVGCFAQDFAPSPMLVEAYLSLLGMVTAAGHHEHCTLTPGKACTPPHKVLSDVLQAFVAKIPLPALQPPTVNSLLRMVLNPLPDSDSAAMGAATLWAVVQGGGVGPGGVTWPDWAQCVSEAWAHAWMYKISTRHRRTAVPRHISAAEEEGNERGSRADEQCAVQGPLVEAEAGQAVTAATLELMLAVLRGSEDTDANALSGKDVLSGLVQLATHVLRICSAAQSSLLCMLDAYGMDLVAVISCMLHHFEEWPDSSTSKLEDLRGATGSFKEQNAALLAQLMPQDDVLDMPFQQAALHDALGSAIQQHCCIVGRDRSDRQESASEAGSDACADDSWSESESEIPVAFDSLKTSCCESTPKAAGLARQKNAKSTNPFIQAAMAEARQSCTNNCQDLDGDGGSYSDLEDFIVCKPNRSYTSLFSKHYKYSALG